MTRASDFGFDRRGEERSDSLLRGVAQYSAQIVASIEAIRQNSTRADLESPDGHRVLALKLRAFCELMAFTDAKERLLVLNPRNPIQKCVAAVMDSAFFHSTDDTAALILEAATEYSPRLLVQFCWYFNTDWNVAALLRDRRSFHETQPDPSVDDLQEAEVPPVKQRGRPPRDKPRITVDAAMYAQLTKDNESRNWTAQEWSEHTGYARSTILNCVTWKSISKNRESDKQDRKSRTPKNLYQ